MRTGCSAPLRPTTRREMAFPVGVARRLHTEVPASTLVEIPDAAHMAHFDNPQAWLGAIRAFLGAQQAAV